MNPNNPPVIDRFWQAIHRIQACGSTVNHHANSQDLIAINLDHLKVKASSNGVELPEASGGLHRLLIFSQAPRYLGAWRVQSTITGQRLLCLVFNARQEFA